MNPANKITGTQRFEFMQKLATEVRAKNGLILGEWEQNFLAGWQRSSRPTLWFIGERPKFVDRMWMKYGSEVGLKFPLLESTPVKTPEADAGCCQFLVMDESHRQLPCNVTATKMRRDGFRYCDPHAEQVQAYARRRQKVVTLVPAALAIEGKEKS